MVDFNTSGLTTDKHHPPRSIRELSVEEQNERFDRALEKSRQETERDIQSAYEYFTRRRTEQKLDAERQARASENEEAMLAKKHEQARSRELWNECDDDDDEIDDEPDRETSRSILSDAILDDDDDLIDDEDETENSVPEHLHGAYDHYLREHTFWCETNTCKGQRLIVIQPWMAAACKDLNSGIQGNAVRVVAQLNYYFRENKYNHRIRASAIRRQHHIWVAKTRRRFAWECFISPSQMRRAMDVLVEHGFVIRKHWRFNGMRTGHYRLNWDKLEDAAQRNGWKPAWERLQIINPADADEDYEDLKNAAES